MTIHKIEIELTDEQIEDFCRDHYYCDPDEETGEREKWQPFEYDDDAVIDQHIDNDVWALKQFLGIKSERRIR